MAAKKSKSSKPNLLKWRNPLIVAVLLLTIGAIFVLKNQPSAKATANPTAAVDENVIEQIPTSVSGLPADALPEEQVDYYIEHGQAAFIFFHSNNCQSCIDMMAVVDEVYPEFQEVLPIVDVNVYDPLNQNLLRRAQINTIPTQVFLAADGEGRISIGVMTPEQLREQLSILEDSSQ